MSQIRSQSLRSMSLTALRKEAASRGIKGLSKSPRETVYAALRSHCRPMGNDRRKAIYCVQNIRQGAALNRTIDGLKSAHTPRQSRRIAHKANRAAKRDV